MINKHILTDFGKESLKETYKQRFEFQGEHFFKIKPNLFGSTSISHLFRFPFWRKQCKKRGIVFVDVPHNPERLGYGCDVAMQCEPAEFEQMASILMQIYRVHERISTGSFSSILAKHSPDVSADEMLHREIYDDLMNDDSI